MTNNTNKMFEQDFNIEKLLEILKRRKGLIILTFFFCLIFSLFYIILNLNYTSSTEILVRPKEEQSFYPYPIVRQSNQDLFKLLSIIIRSQPFVDQVHKSYTRKTGHDIDFQTFYRYIVKNLTIKQVSKIIFKISFTDSMPGKSKRMAEIIVDTFLEYNYSRAIKNDLEHQKKILKPQLKPAINRLENSLKELYSYKVNKLSEKKLDDNFQEKSISELAAERSDLKNDIKKKIRLINFLNEVSNNLTINNFNKVLFLNHDLFNVFFTNKTLKEKYNKLKVTEKERLILSQNIRKNKIILKKITRTINSLKNSIISLIQIETISLIPQEENNLIILRNNLDSINKIINDKPKEKIKMVELEQTVEVNEKIYTELIKRYIESSIGSIGEMRKNIINPPTQPTFINNTFYRRTVLSIILALFLSLSVAFSIEWMDNSLNSIDKVKYSINVPILGYIPDFNAKSKGHYGSYYSYYSYYSRRNKSEKEINEINHLKEEYPSIPMIYSSMSIAAEKIRSLRTNILAQFPHKGSKTIGIVSSIHNEGKSTVSLNISIAFAQLGYKTILIDADLRCSRTDEVISHDIDIKKQNGLIQILENKVDYKECCINKFSENLDIVLAGGSSSEPSELLSSQSCDNLLKRLKSDYKIVILDLPPVIPVTDSSVLTPKLDGILYLIELGNPSKSTVLYGIEQLYNVNAPIAGLILNKISQEKGYYKKYGYYY